MIKLRTPQEQVDEIIRRKLTGESNRQIAKAVLGKKSKQSTVNDIYHAWLKGEAITTFLVSEDSKRAAAHLPKILTLDIETSPTAFSGWAMFNQNFSVDQIEREWFLMSFTAKWAHKEDIIYMDMRGKFATEDDTELLLKLYELLDEADIVVGQNHRKFDMKKINARMLMKGITKPYSPVKTEDTLDIAKRKFGFTSNKLAWLSEHLNVKFKKSAHEGYDGFKLWKACMQEDPLAWETMEHYNIHDVLSTEELWWKLRAWDDKSVNFALYFDDTDMMCSCGNTHLEPAGYAYTSLSKFQQYRCPVCGKYMRGRVNLFSKEKRASLLMNILNK